MPTAYLAPEEWYRLWCKYCPCAQAASPAEWKADIDCQIEVMESFPKQTYRNRCTITTPDGPLTLTVPVKHSERKQLTRDVEISYQKHWQHQHWIALVSAYKRTPYFDYYMDYFRPFYEKETKFLLDLNEGLHEVVVGLLQNNPRRCGLQAAPKKGDYVFQTLPHTTDWQAQDLETCFGNGISILDKLMEFGPETIMKIETGNR
ncbi:MAG: WbqC family protein [Paludibacteraceae bacterium]|nr:WbqC family protein [Paludibacteraceae bacterium]